MIFRYGSHFGEEPPLSGSKGSGTIFFSHCTLRCTYCQNYPWSQLYAGETMQIGQLARIFNEITTQGCHNFNLVSPTSWMPQIAEALRVFFQVGMRLPIVYNTSGFESLETFEFFGQFIDIGLVDLRYASEEHARSYSDSQNYVASARACIKWFWQNRGALQMDSNGIAQRGLICRLLILPGLANDAIANLQWLAENIGTDLHLSVMSQYSPVHRAVAIPSLSRKITGKEYDAVVEWVEKLGFEMGWVQPFDTDDAEDLLGCNMPAGAGVVGNAGLKNQTED